MVDANLPRVPTLRYLFLDLNAYFASVEQQECPELRGKPVAVVPMLADTTFTLAASYEAKAHGVKTVMRVSEAKRLCPDLQLVEARPLVYVKYHNLVKRAVESVLPIQKVCSIDEMYSRLLGEERELDRAKELAQKIKKAILSEVGECLTCSIGIGPNPFIAKVATEIQKPDGLIAIEKHELPQRLFGLKLTDFPGINKRIQARLNAAGIFTTEQMCMASEKESHAAWGSVVGPRWHGLLRGEDIKMPDSARKSLSHSHVLGPKLRTEQSCRQVLLRLISKAAARLRTEGLVAKKMGISVDGKQSWEATESFSPTSDNVTFTERFNIMWEKRIFTSPMRVGVVFTELSERLHATPSLFDQTQEREEMSHAMDLINQKFGKNAVYLAAIESAKNSAPERIAFGKTELFQEGRGDNDLDSFSPFGGVFSSSEDQD